MKKAILFGLFVFLLLVGFIGLARGQTPPIAVPPTFTAPQEQASALAVPAQSELKTVVAIVQCNTVIGLLAVDETGEVHPARFTSKAEVEAIQAAVPSDHNFSLNVGCPGKPAKDTTVL